MVSSELVYRNVLNQDLDVCGLNQMFVASKIDTTKRRTVSPKIWESKELKHKKVAAPTNYNYLLPNYNQLQGRFTYW